MKTLGLIGWEAAIQFDKENISEERSQNKMLRKREFVAHAIAYQALTNDPIRKQLAEALDKMPCISPEHLKIKDEALTAYKESLK